MAIGSLAAVSICPVSTAVSAQHAENLDDTLETVEVIAQRETMRKAVVTFVSSVTRFDGESVARWRSPICVSVTGAAREHGEFIRARIVEIAESVGAPLARNQAECSANLFVILTPEPDRLWTTLKTRYPKLFSLLQPRAVERSLSTRPVQTLQNVVFSNADGTSAFSSRSYRHVDSRIRSSVSEDFTSVVVVVNDADTGQASFGQLAEYLAMVALARVDLSADFAAADSILRLFATSASAMPPPARLTVWDRSFLETLYGVDIAVRRPRKLISNTMIRSLALDDR
jgi:hypothetical protein